MPSAALTFQTLSPEILERAANALVQAADVALSIGKRGEVKTAQTASDLGSLVPGRQIVGDQVESLFRNADLPALGGLLDQARAGGIAGPVLLHHADAFAPHSCARYTANRASARSGDVTLLGRQVLPSPHMDSADLIGMIDGSLSEDVREGRERTQAFYKVMFGRAADSILFIDPFAGRVDEANPRAHALFSVNSGELDGRLFSDLFSAEDRDLVSNLLRQATIDPSVHRVAARIGEFSTPVMLRVQAVRSFERRMTMVRIAPSNAHDGSTPHDSAVNAVGILKRSPYPVVIIDGRQSILWTNGAFDAAHPGVSGATAFVADRMRLSSHALGVALEQVRTRGAMRMAFASLMLGGGANVTGNEVTLVDLSRGSRDVAGLVFDTPVDVPTTDSGLGHGADAEALVNLVGRAPLKALVRGTTDALEKSYIEAALRLTGNNRAAAANALGVSRQSLYAKLKQFGLE